MVAHLVVANDQGAGAAVEGDEQDEHVVVRAATQQAFENCFIGVCMISLTYVLFTMSILHRSLYSLRLTVSRKPSNLVTTTIGFSG